MKKKLSFTIGVLVENQVYGNSMHLPDTIKIIGSSASTNCTKLPQITIPDSATMYNSYRKKREAEFGFSKRKTWTKEESMV